MPAGESRSRPSASLSNDSTSKLTSRAFDSISRDVAESRTVILGKSPVRGDRVKLELHLQSGHQGVDRLPFGDRRAGKGHTRGHDPGPRDVVFESL